jgi:hypothetical protein
VPRAGVAPEIGRETALKGGIAKPSPVDVRHPLAFVLEEWAAGDVRPYAAAKKQQSETQSEYLAKYLDLRQFRTPSWALGFDCP